MSEPAPSAGDLFAEIHGARLFFEDEGEGAPLVLIHAGVADLRMWDDFVPAFSKRFRVIRYDLRGFGRSSMPPGVFSHIEDLHGVLDAREVGRAHLVGASFGGRVATEFAIRYPLRAASLSLVAPGLGGFEWSKDMLEYGKQSDALAAAGDLDALVDLDLRTWLAGPRRTLEALDPELVAKLAKLVRGANARWAEQARGTPQWLDPPAASRLRSLRAPALIMVGDCDMPDLLAIASFMQREIPAAKKLVFEGAAHMLPLERPREFARAVLDFAGQAGALPTVRGRH